MFICFQHDVNVMLQVRNGRGRFKKSPGDVNRPFINLVSLMAIEGVSLRIIIPKRSVSWLFCVLWDLMLIDWPNILLQRTSREDDGFVVTGKMSCMMCAV